MDWSAMDSRYSKKSAFGLGLTGTIAGGLALLNQHGGLGGLFGGNSGSCSTNADSQACAFVSKDTFWRQNLDIQKEFGDQKYDNLKANYDLYINLDAKIGALAVKNAQLEASLPLAMQLAAVNAERFTEHAVSDVKEHQAAINCALQTEILMRPKGKVGLPFSDLITGIPTLPKVVYNLTDCGCGGTPA